MNKLLALLLLVLSAAVMATTSDATTPGKNGLIVYQGPPPHRLWVVGADGTGLRKLTTTKGMQLSYEDPDWSPDGQG